MCIYNCWRCLVFSSRPGWEKPVKCCPFVLWGFTIWYISISLETTHKSVESRRALLLMSLIATLLFLTVFAAARMFTLSLVFYRPFFILFLIHLQHFKRTLCVCPLNKTLWPSASHPYFNEGRPNKYLELAQKLNDCVYFTIKWLVYGRRPPQFIHVHKSRENTKRNT